MQINANKWDGDYTGVDRRGKKEAVSACASAATLPAYWAAVLAVNDAMTYSDGFDYTNREICHLLLPGHDSIVICM